MSPEVLDTIRSSDKRCGDNETVFFPVAIDRRRLLEYVDELRAELAALRSSYYEGRAIVTP
jgi:hypothetical protein